MNHKLRKHSELTYNEYVKIYKQPPQPIIKPLTSNLDIPPLTLCPEDDLFLLPSNPSDMEAKSTSKSNRSKNSNTKENFTFPLDKDLPKIPELAREDSKYTESEQTIGYNNSSKEFFINSDKNIVLPESKEKVPNSRFCVAFEDILPEENFFDGDNNDFQMLEEDYDYKDDLIRTGDEARKKSSKDLKSKSKESKNNNIKIYCMNRDGNYSGTTGLSRKESMKVTGSRDKKGGFSDSMNNTEKISNENDDYNPKMFKYSLQGSIKLGSDAKGPRSRKLSEPVHLNGGKTIFGHLEKLNRNRINHLIQDRNRNYCKNETPIE